MGENAIVIKIKLAKTTPTRFTVYSLTFQHLRCCQID